MPIPKKGNIDDLNNYRGITLTSIFSKIFSCIIDNRLRQWPEHCNVLNDFQFGFRKGKSTTDSNFILSSIIDRVLNIEKRRNYIVHFLI